MADNKQNDDGQVYMARTEFTGLGDLGQHVGNNLKGAIKAGVGADFEWPNWDEKALGKPPTLVMPAGQSKLDVAEFSRVLSHISTMASLDSADELRSQLKALSGKEVNIKDLHGNQDETQGPIGTPRVRAVGGHIGNEPEISFNPNAWGRYPVEGSKTEHAIATPEQMFIHEIGHYLEIQKINDNLMQKNSQTNVPVGAGTEEQRAYSNALDEKHITKDVENKVMSSVDVNFKKRDVDRYAEGGILFENNQGYPNVTEQDRANLIHAMKVSGRVVPNELEMPKSGPVSMNSTQENQTQAVNAIASKEVLEKYFAQLEKDGVSTQKLDDLRKNTNEIIATNFANGTLPTVEQKVNVINSQDNVETKTA